MDTSDYITVELHIRPDVLRFPHLSPQEQLAEDDALATILGRQALAKARAALIEA